jgi:Tfp pilus assembly protein PilO
MTTIEQKEIRGITGKLLRGTIWQTIVIVVTVCGFYYQLKSDIRELYTLREESEKYWQLKFDQIQIQNSILQKQLDEISIRLENLRTQIERK